MSRLVSGDSTVAIVECHASEVFVVHSGGTGDQPNSNPYAMFRCAVDIFLNVSNCEI